MSAHSLWWLRRWRRCAGPLFTCSKARWELPCMTRLLPHSVWTAFGGMQSASLRKWSLVCSTLVVALKAAGGAPLGRAFSICCMIQKRTVLQLLCVPQA